MNSSADLPVEFKGRGVARGDHLGGGLYVNAFPPGGNADFGDPELTNLFWPGRQARQGLCREKAFSPDLLFSPDLFPPGKRNHI